MKDFMRFVLFNIIISSVGFFSSNNRAEFASSHKTLYSTSITLSVNEAKYKKKATPEGVATNQFPKRE